MREIKFKAWSLVSEKLKMVYLNPRKSSFSSRDLVNDNSWHVMQYTGLKDKNGKEIYEGDVAWCFDEHETKSEIKWSELLGGWRWRESLAMMYIKDLEVIGNIYENPNLLKNEN